MGRELGLFVSDRTGLPELRPAVDVPEPYDRAVEWGGADPSYFCEPGIGGPPTAVGWQRTATAVAGLAGMPEGGC
jgi:hypothetical protein